jgi:hypothetical protein
MSYLFDDFKGIRTFPSETRVFVDGVFAPELSESNPDLPLHIIHVGKIAGGHVWKIDMDDPRDVFLTARIDVAACAEIKIEINANVPGRRFDGKVIVKNTGSFALFATGSNNAAATKIALDAKLFAGAGSENTLSGTAVVPRGADDCVSDISLAALCDPRMASLRMSPSQRIAGADAAAGHSASIWRPAPAQIRYLETAGLTSAAAADLLNKVFLEEEI